VSRLAATLATVKPFPAVVEAARRAAANPRAGVMDVVRVVEGDVGIATDLLRVANAPASGLAQRCTSVRHAASLLGMKRVVEVVAAAAALAFVEESVGDFPALAAHAVAVAGVARALAPITGIPEDEAFTVGLLHDVGVLLLLQAEDPFYDGLLEMDSGEEPTVEDERAVMGFDHPALGGAVARKWNLPSPLPEVIELHHDWAGATKAGGAVCAMVALIRAADRLVAMLRDAKTPSLDDLTPLLDEPAFAHLGLTREELFARWEGLQWASTRINAVGGGSEPRPPRPTGSGAMPIPKAPPPRPAPPVAAPRAAPTALVAPEVENSHVWKLMAAGIALLGALVGVALLL